LRWLRLVSALPGRAEAGQHTATFVARDWLGNTTSQIEHVTVA